MSDPLRNMIRASVREIIKDEIAKAVKEVIAEEVQGALRPDAEPASPAKPEKRRATHVVVHPAGTKVRVNNTSGGPHVHHHTDVWKVWIAVRDHIGIDSMSRTQLAAEIGTLLDLHKYAVSGIISRLLTEGCLLAVKE